MLRALQLVSIDKRDDLLKEYVDFWSKALANPDGVKFDDQTLRDAFHPEDEAHSGTGARHSRPGRIGNGLYSGSGLPFVSGAKGRASRPTRNTEHIVMPAYRMGSGKPLKTLLVKNPFTDGPAAATRRPTL